MTNLNLNQCVFGGRLVEDPELRKTSSDISCVRFTLAVNRAFQKKGEDRKADFPKFTVWRGDADFLSKHAQKGDAVLVVGEYNESSFTTKDGEKRYNHEFIVKPGSLQIVSCKNWDAKAAAKGNNTGSRSAAPAPVSGPEDYGDFEDMGDSDDLPF